MAPPTFSFPTAPAPATAAAAAASGGAGPSSAWIASGSSKISARSLRFVVDHRQRGGQLPRLVLNHAPHLALAPPHRLHRSRLRV